MSTNPNNPILNVDLLKRISGLAFSGYLTRGRGCIIIIDAEEDICGELISEAFDSLDYITHADSEFPVEAKDMVEAYDPDAEFIFAIKTTGAKILVLKLSESQIKTKPIEAFREWQEAQGQGIWVQGELLKKKETDEPYEPNDPAEAIIDSEGLELEDANYIFLDRIIPPLILLRLFLVLLPAL